MHFDAGDAVRFGRRVLGEFDRPRGVEVRRSSTKETRMQDPKFNRRFDAGTPSQITSHCEGSGPELSISELVHLEPSLDSKSFGSSGSRMILGEKTLPGVHAFRVCASCCWKPRTSQDLIRQHTVTLQVLALECLKLLHVHTSSFLPVLR